MKYAISSAPAENDNSMKVKSVKIEIHLNSNIPCDRYFLAAYMLNSAEISQLYWKCFRFAVEINMTEHVCVVGGMGGGGGGGGGGGSITKNNPQNAKTTLKIHVS